MQRFHQTLPLWVRAVLLVGLLCLAAGASLIAYRYYQRPTTLTVAGMLFLEFANNDKLKGATVEILAGTGAGARL